MSGVGYLPFCESLAREAPETPQIIKAIATAFSCMPGLDSDTLLLKTPHMHALTVEHGDIKLHWSDRAVGAAGGELSPAFQLGYGPCVLKRQHVRHDVHACAMGKTNSLLNGLKAHYRKGNPSLVP